MKSNCFLSISIDIEKIDNIRHIVNGGENETEATIITITKNRHTKMFQSHTHTQILSETHTHADTVNIDTVQRVKNRLFFALFSIHRKHNQTHLQTNINTPLTQSLASPIYTQLKSII